MVEHSGFEPLTSTMRMLRATNCANAPRRLSAWLVYHQVTVSSRAIERFLERVLAQYRDAGMDTKLLIYSIDTSLRSFIMQTPRAQMDARCE